jgi:rhodanese-related sulfurtransferase
VRLAPEELKEMLDAGRPVVIVDLRHPLDSVSDPRTLPGAIRMLPEDVEEKAASLPRNSDIILYCT